MKIILHVDIDAFFPSAAMIENPTLRGKAIAIGQNGPRGVISSASYAARAFGVCAGTPTFKLAKLSREIVVVKPNYNLYTLLSLKFFELLKKDFSPLMEIVSIDECYLDITKTWQKDRTVRNFCNRLKATVFKELGLDVSIGVSTNKFLAKMATNLGKPDGLTLLSPRDVATKIWPLPIAAYYGIGRQTIPRLRAWGVATIGDLLTLENHKLTTLFGINTPNILAQARGKGNDLLQKAKQFQGISHAITFRTSDSNNEQFILKILKNIVQFVVTKVRAEHLIGCVVTVFIKNAAHQTISRRQKLTNYTNDQAFLWKTAFSLFYKLWNGQTLRLVGFGISNLMQQSDFEKQLSLFKDPQEISKEATIIAKINAQYSNPIVFAAEQLLEQQAPPEASFEHETDLETLFNN